MTRHGKNCTNGAVYSYHERRKDAKASGFGSEKARFSKDSIKGFDCCCLTLQPCDNPVVTKQGWLYDKEAIIKYMLEKKKEYAKKLKEYERQKDEDIKELHEIMIIFVQRKSYPVNEDSIDCVQILLIFAFESVRLTLDLCKYVNYFLFGIISMDFHIIDLKSVFEKFNRIVFSFFSVLIFNFFKFV